jgi:hypothetical protein
MPTRNDLRHLSDMPSKLKQTELAMPLWQIRLKIPIPVGQASKSSANAQMNLWSDRQRMRWR